MKAILIARVSTEEQKEAGNSLPAQVVRLEKYCINKGFTILKTCSFDESAYIDQRNEFDKIIDFILEQKEKIAVCCDKVDRLSRNTFDKRISILYEKAIKDEIELHFVSDGQIITSSISATQKFQFSINLGLAKYYSDAISDNIKRALEQKRRKGEWSSKAPYGYKNIRHPDGKSDIMVDDYQSKVVQKIYELYATGAYSMLLICKKIKEDYGINWSKGYLDFVMKNPFYSGIMKSNGKLYPHCYPPIISTNLFNQVQEMKSSFSNKKGYKYIGKPYLYRGLLKCADCGLAITPEKHKGHVYYHCTQYNGKHGAAWIREEEITKQFGEIFKTIQMPLEVASSITDSLNELHLNKIEFHNKQFDEITKEQKSLTKMLDNLYLDKLKGSITTTDYDRYYQKLREQLNEITTRGALLQEAEDNYYMTAKHVVNLVNKAYDLFIGSEVEERRQLIKLVLSNLTLKDKNIVYEAHKPFNLLLECSGSQTWCAR